MARIDMPAAPREASHMMTALAMEMSFAAMFNSLSRT